MAFFDDRRFLLSNIRHSFITGDDTGMSEMTMLNELMPHHLPSDLDKDFLDSLQVDTGRSDLLEVAQSYDIVSDMEMIGSHRRRSNTAQRLERLHKERKSQAKVKVIQWKDQPNATVSEEELRQLFPSYSEERPLVSKGKARSSALSSQIEKFPSIPNNPFNEFSRFDHRVNCSSSAIGGPMMTSGDPLVSSPSKRIIIFLTMLPKGERDYPMQVVSLASARVLELIGLICWQYTNEGREPKLKSSVNHYCLRIAEENGDVDPDFPSLNPKEPIAKFGFPVLALVEKEEEELCASLVVTVHIEEMFSKLEAPNLQVTLQWVLDQTLRKRKSAIDEGSEYKLEATKEPGIALDLSLSLADVTFRDFKLLREQEPSGPSYEETPSNLPDMLPIEAPMYRTFVVSAIHKLSRSVDVQLGISGYKVDINPLPNKASSKIWSWQPKAATFTVKDVVDCELVKITGEKATFKLVYHTGSEYQSQKFESDTKVCQDIVKKVKYVMKMRSSSVRDAYLAIKESKLQGKQSNQHLA